MLLVCQCKTIVLSFAKLNNILHVRFL
jgi:hypothetical protein